MSCDDKTTPVQVLQTREQAPELKQAESWLKGAVDWERDEGGKYGNDASVIIGELDRLRSEVACLVQENAELKAKSRPSSGPGSREDLLDKIHAYAEEWKTGNSPAHSLAKTALYIALDNYDFRGRPADSAYSAPQLAETEIYQKLASVVAWFGTAYLHAGESPLVPAVRLLQELRQERMLHGLACRMMSLSSGQAIERVKWTAWVHAKDPDDAHDTYRRGYHYSDRETCRGAAQIAEETLYRINLTVTKVPDEKASEPGPGGPAGGSS